MTQHVTFQTRARTIDHLGREQIADCPTAISELWKNAYDAYAKQVCLHIFEGDMKVSAIVDDGHGMNRNEFESKWLIVGTESKTNGFSIPERDRDGLAERPKQGQKGIGRLSSAALGPLLLLISKRKNSDYVAALIDWRLFENPFLFLNDVQIPVSEFIHKNDLSEVLPQLFDQMMGNIWGNSDDPARTKRIADAWSAFSKQETEDGLEVTTQEKIEETLIQDVFKEEHFSKWGVWSGDSTHGTAMFIADVQYDIYIQLSSTELNQADDTEKSTRERFFQTLSNFTDPFSRNDEPVIDDFSYSVTGWINNAPRIIIGENREFDLRNLEELEHIIEGEVDSEGYFKGRVKVFGEWIEEYSIKPKQIYKTRKDSAFGPFHLRIGSYEWNYNSSSLNDSQHAHFIEQSEKYGGLKVYRDGLRVMPYGRADSDYFSIEERRSKNAGRYFWSNRRMFGRIAITRENNPNLKDKAGREGFIENRASKLFREIVEKILQDSADKHFGRLAKERKSTIDDIKEKKAQLKADEDRSKLLNKERTRIRTSIKRNMASLVKLVSTLSEFKDNLAGRLSLDSIDDLQALKVATDEFYETIQGYSLSPIPANLGRLEDDYRAYRKEELYCKEIIKDITYTINKAIAESSQKSDYEKAYEVYRSKLASINNSITRYAARGKEMLLKQQVELEDLIKNCREQYKLTMEESLEDLNLARVSLPVVLEKLDAEQEKIEIENAQKLSPYVTALERINEQIDLEGLAIHSMNESVRYRDELARLHSLAQLGITVEIIGHELDGLDQELTYALKVIKDDELTPNQKKNIDVALNCHNSLIDKLKFLSPLKLSGKKEIQKITGLGIEEYITGYFSKQLSTADIHLSCTPEFRSISIMDLQSRIFPVFINIINNSIYWVQRIESNKKEILLSCTDDEVFISDNGPGVDVDDLESLFTLFFTRKQKGGRGVGLYLCKQNLKAGGHSIRYEVRDTFKKLNGANFAIAFKGLIND
ncbi:MULTISPECIES: ATP-binding protein [unclassified Brenneria]|uniref:ATP-binding protein n=1 Tax=unclassified Brenneria TaxID=2634434 RepID=UPI00155656C8|nr:ATP-binding protein [Brenneria sp. hezel4-2-4]MEE3649904.1 ATP-binding protein [Brenneria sp. HEZEL_4_2_4]NPC99862.1 histidine kinase [Brenneria sp. hezel4-2-4]